MATLAGRSHRWCHCCSRGTATGPGVRQCSARPRRGDLRSLRSDHHRLFCGTVWRNTGPSERTDRPDECHGGRCGQQSRGSRSKPGAQPGRHACHGDGRSGSWRITADPDGGASPRAIHHSGSLFRGLRVHVGDRRDHSVPPDWPSVGDQ